ncbi:MAG: glycosyltransferase, partial [Acidimicrobiales bacterium]
GEPGAIIRAAAALGVFDVAVVQHEFGIYDGPDGDSVVGVLALLDVPSIVVAHTVLADPTPHQREVLERVADHASILVTMSETARRRLVERYDVDASRVVVIPHGAPAPTALASTALAHPALAPMALARPAERADHAASPRFLTWGLLGPGKGIERVVDVLPSLRDLAPRPHYLVVGETHPRVLESEGERYRDALWERAEHLGVADMMTLQAGYLDVASLRRVVATADVVVLPYDSHEQVTSGVLIEAVAARKPVVATAFAHACELLGSGAGLVVDHDDPGAMASALRRVLCEPGLAAAMASRAGDLASELLWPAVAARYHALGARLARDRSVAVA